MFDDNKFRTYVLFFLLGFLPSLLFLPIQGVFTELFLRSFDPTYVRSLPKVIGASIDGLATLSGFAGVVLYRNFSDSPSRWVLIVTATLLLLTIAILIIDQFYTIPL
ncbi:MAG: hypothetical protein WD579_02385 [Candidatus Paceibacterota bacterium]